MKFKTILFDLDGTLIDTIPLWQRAYLETLQKEGVTLDLDEFMAKIYHGNAHFNTIFEEYGFPEEEWIRIREDRDRQYCNLLRKESAWMDGAKELLEFAKAIHPIGMMTGSWTRYVDAIDKKLDIYAHFSAVVTCDDTQEGRSKPNPYGLELLAEQLGVDAKECLYVGDQKFDVGAANAANMTSCLIWREWTPVGADEGADITCSSLDELLELLQ